MPPFANWWPHSAWLVRNYFKSASVYPEYVIIRQKMINCLKGSSALLQTPSTRFCMTNFINFPRAILPNLCASKWWPLYCIHLITPLPQWCQFFRRLCEWKLFVHCGRLLFLSINLPWPIFLLLKTKRSSKCRSNSRKTVLSSVKHSGGRKVKLRQGLGAEFICLRALSLCNET